MKEILKRINLIVLGLLMLVPGLVKLFMFKPAGVTAMLNGLGFPLPMFFAWILILSEIVFGILILFKYKLNYTKYVPVLILFIATILTTIGNWSSFLLHVLAIINYLQLKK